MNNQEIHLSHVYKSHGKREILKDVSFKAMPGKVTAFLGVNGAGKSSTLRVLLGLDHPSSGSGTFGHQLYRQIKRPLTVVGAVFDGVGGAKARKVNTHLRIVAQSNHLPTSRVDEVLQLVHLTPKRQARLGTLSLGEGQRLGLAQALLGDPQFLVLDEPTNGLDPNGMRWFRDFIQKQAKLGKTILFSSHILSDVEEMADDVVMIEKGKIVTTATLADIHQKQLSLEEMFFKMTGQEGLQ